MADLSKQSSPRGNPPAGLDPTIAYPITVATLCIVAWAVFGMMTSPGVSEADITFEPMTIDLDRLRAERRQRSAGIERGEVVDELRELLATAHEANRMGFDEEADGQARQKLEVRLSIFANEIMPTFGYEGFIYSAEPMFIECGEGLEALLAGIRDGALSIDEALEGPPEEAYSAYRRSCGQVMPMLLEQGLVTRDGEWEDDSSPVIFDILNRYRWAHVIHDRKRATTQLTPYELEIMMRWRIEQAKAFSTQERQRFLRLAARVLPDYPAHWARGVLAWRAGDVDGAIDQFERAAQASEHPKAAPIVRLLRGDAAR